MSIDIRLMKRYIHADNAQATNVDPGDLE